MPHQNLQQDFDQWAQTYDADLQNASNTFPFAGYERTLAAIFEEANVQPGLTVLDLGAGTGNLTRLFVDARCHVTAADFSPEMLAKARAKLPRVPLIQVDLTADQWPAALEQPFERIVSNYLFHEFPWQTKLDILHRLAQGHLTPRGDAAIIIGDIMFPTQSALDATRTAAADHWDEEYYWILDQALPALRAAGWTARATPTSFCAAVLHLTPSPPPPL